MNGFQGNLTLRERLDAAATSGSLSTADLSRWFGISYSTLQKWRREGSEPYARRRQILERLTWLEYALATDKRLPVPVQVKRDERKGYLEAIRAAYS